MSEKNILIKDKIIRGVSDEYPEENGATDILVSGKSLYDMEQALIGLIVDAGGDVVENINASLVSGLAEQLVIINRNTALISDIDTVINTDLPLLDVAIADTDDAITNLETQMVPLEAKNAQSVTNTNSINSALANMEVRDFVDIVIAGDNDKFYPIWWLFSNIESSTIVIKKDGTGAGNRGLYLEMIGIGGNEKDKYTRSLFIKEFTDKDGLSAKLLSLNMYSFEGLGNEANSDYIAHCASGIYLRGDSTYQLWCELPDIKTQIQNCVASGIASIKSVSDSNHTYYMVPILEADVNTIIPDKDLLFENTIKKFIMPGDTAVHQGGTYLNAVPEAVQTNVIQHSSISTAANAVNTGILPAIRYRMSATSNGSGDIALAACGGYETFSSTFKYRSSISTASDAVSLGSLNSPQYDIMSTSNGADDICCYAGGGYAGVYVTSTERIVVSTDVTLDTAAVLIDPIGKGGCTSNLTYDVGIITGGLTTGVVQTTGISQFILSTNTDSVATGNTNEANEAGRLVSNGISDIAMDVESLPVVAYARTIVISTATNCIVSGDINTYGYSLASHASNSIGDTAIYAGGDVYTDSIRQYSISTPACAMGVGVLTEALRDAAGTSNG